MPEHSIRTATPVPPEASRPHEQAAVPETADTTRTNGPEATASLEWAGTADDGDRRAVPDEWEAADTVRTIPRAMAEPEEMPSD